jgi:hypothetical protein
MKDKKPKVGERITEAMTSAHEAALPARRAVYGVARRLKDAITGNSAVRRQTNTVRQGVSDVKSLLPGNRIREGNRKILGR